MCGLDYESILNTHQKEENKRYIEDLHKQKGFTKAMEGPGGYFLEPGGYIEDKRNTKYKNTFHFETQSYFYPTSFSPSEYFFTFSTSWC
jgi:hypothetical protein